MLVLDWLDEDEDLLEERLLDKLLERLEERLLDKLDDRLRDRLLEMRLVQLIGHNDVATGIGVTICVIVDVVKDEAGYAHEQTEDI